LLFREHADRNASPRSTADVHLHLGASTIIVGTATTAGVIITDPA